MKRTTMKLIISCAILGALLPGCKKEKNEEASCPATQSGLAGTYRLTALKYKMSANAAEQDYLQYLDACERDDLITLNANGTYIHRDAGTTCLPSGDDSGNWSVNGSTLTSDDYMNGTISSYDCHTLVFHIDNLVVAGDTYIFTMVKQ